MKRKVVICQTKRERERKKQLLKFRSNLAIAIFAVLKWRRNQKRLRAFKSNFQLIRNIQFSLLTDRQTYFIFASTSIDNKTWFSPLHLHQMFDVFVYFSTFCVAAVQVRLGIGIDYKFSLLKIVFLSLPSRSIVCRLLFFIFVFLVSFQTAASHCDLVWNVIFDDIDAMLLPVIDFVERDVKSKWQHRIDIWWMSSLALRCAPLISISIDENETEKIMISFLSLFFSSRFVLLCFRESEINECWVKFFALSSVD